MRIPLTRIEYEYVLETFLEDTPPLVLQTGTFFLSLPSSAYSIKQSRVYFRAPQNLIGKEVSVFFNHKKRGVSFYTSVQPSLNGCYFSLPDIVYKYNPDIQKGRVVAEICVAETPSLIAQEHERFPLDSIMHVGRQLPSFTDFLPSAYQTAVQYTAEESSHENTFPLFLYRLHDFEQHTSVIFESTVNKGLYILFIDSKLLICGCKDSYAVSIGKRQAVRFVLRFPHRTIRILKGRSLFSHFIPKSNNAVIGFLFEDVFEEDKRFLYERVYHEKYNPFSF